MTNQTNEAGYNTWSAFYDQYPNPTVAIDELTFPDYYAELQNSAVLEIGCGTGRHTVRLLAAGNRVTGIDISAGMLDRLREKISSPELTLVQGDFLTADLPGRFDAILASLVLEHIEDLSAFFHQAKNLLKPGGRVYLSEIHPARTAAGIFAHFKNADGSEVRLQSYPHTLVGVENAAVEAGLRVRTSITACGINDLAKIKPEWIRYFSQPMIQIWVLQAV